MYMFWLKMQTKNKKYFIYCYTWKRLIRLFFLFLYLQYHLTYLS